MLDGIKELWELVINSSSIVNSVTILSIIITVVIFVYQERKAISEHNREEIRLKDEIVDLIIRNEVNNNLLISSVNQLDRMLEGYELLKNSKFRYNSEDIVKIAYAKVYESEYINQNERKVVLKRLEDYLNEYDINRGYYNEEVRNDNFDDISIRFYSFINIVVFSICIYMSISIYINPYVPDIIKSIILSIAILLPIFASNYIFRVINSICKKIIIVYRLCKVKNIDNRFLKESKDESNTSSINNYLPIKSENNKEVRFETLFTSNREYVTGIAEQRIIIEQLLKLICRQNIDNKDYEQSKYYSAAEMIGVLSKSDILNPTLANRVRTFYNKSSEVMHTGQLRKNGFSMDEEELLDAMKDVASQLYSIVENEM